MSKRAPLIPDLWLDRGRVPSFDEYPFNIPAIAALDHMVFSSPVTFFVGENGSGKSTLLEAIAATTGLNPEGGSKHLQFQTRGSHSILFKYLRLSRTSAHACSDGFFLRAESFYNVATQLESINDSMKNYGGRSPHLQSHGEAFLATMMHRFGSGGFFLLDEPESALSPQRQLALLRLIDSLVDLDSQFIIATHSPILLAYPGAVIYEFNLAGIREIEYEATDSYLITRAFFEHRDEMLKSILAKDA